MLLVEDRGYECGEVEAKRMRRERASLGAGKAGYLSGGRALGLGGGKLERMGGWDLVWVYGDCRGRGGKRVEGEGSGPGFG